MGAIDIEGPGPVLRADRGHRGHEVKSLIDERTGIELDIGTSEGVRDHLIDQLVGTDTLVVVDGEGQAVVEEGGLKAGIPRRILLPAEVGIGELGDVALELLALALVLSKAHDQARCLVIGDITLDTIGALEAKEIEPADVL